MAKAKKFGAFSGVFTPSVLTILGVIMYLRLPWIVGQAGLLSTLGIILVAHIISISTGLSVASIATDKRVETGGPYFIISRSLGLPIGGTLGYALYIGLSFSVSLYLIGFAESFLGYFGFEVNLFNIRIAGSIILLLVTIITFVSTSLTIKTQYLILVAILLSLLAVFLGNHEYHPTYRQLEKIPGSLPWITLFAIFFPAVTGFTAGAAMSGDLKDSRKDIPLGIMAAILVGLLIYVSLAFFLSFTVSSDLLVNDPNVLFQISFIPQLVIAGILGATLSSALGCMLGAPRIMQAISGDRIAPSFLNKSYGASKEPRNALILTFFIAQAGILIGELNVIARLVSIFFIIIYGFLNITYTVESWASSDFRPSFKIPRFVSIIGSLACIVVMIQLDILAMAGASLVLVSLFLYLKNKELTLNTGDTRSSIWLSLVKTGLLKLTKSQTNTRNWRPNVILFSGGASARPHLIETGKAMIGKLGIFTSFELIENPDDNLLFSRTASVSAETIGEHTNIITRKHVCKDIYEGIEMISKIYGFSGFEPNTILMGWPRKTKNPKKLSELLLNLKKLDFNLAFLDYDKEAGFGKHKKIDFWWSGKGRNLSLALHFIRFITGTPEWRNAEVRILTINPDNKHTERYYAILEQVLENYRIRAEVKVINNLEKLTETDIMRSESSGIDLTMLEIPDINKNNVQSIITHTGNISIDLKSCLMISASSGFEEIKVMSDLPQLSQDRTPVYSDQKPVSSILENLNLAGKDIVYNEIYNLARLLEDHTKKLLDHTFIPIPESRNAFIDQFATLMDKTMEKLVKANELTTQKEKHWEFLKILNDYSYHAQKQLVNFREHCLNYEKETLLKGLEQYLSETEKSLHTLPETIRLKFGREDFRQLKPTGPIKWLNKAVKLLWINISGNEVSHRIKIYKASRYFLYHKRLLYFTKFAESYTAQSLITFTELKSLLIGEHDIIEKAFSGKLTLDEIVKEKNNFKNLLRNLQIRNREFIYSESYNLLYDLTGNLENLNKTAQNPQAGRLNHKFGSVIKKDIQLRSLLSDFPELWQRTMVNYINKTYLDFLYLTLKDRLRTKLEKTILDLEVLIEGDVQNKLRTFEKQLKEFLEKGELLISKKIPLDQKNTSIPKLDEHFNILFNEIEMSVDELPESIQLTSDELSENIQLELMESINEIIVSVRKTADFYISNELNSLLKKQWQKCKHELSLSLDKIRDLMRLANFHLFSRSNNHAGETETVMNREQREALIANLVKSIRTEEQKLQEMIREFRKTFETGLKNAFEPLSSAVIIKTEAGIKKKTRYTGQQFFFNRFHSLKESISDKITEQFVTLLYGKSEGQLWAWRLDQAREKASLHPGERTKNMLEKISPHKIILDTLPFYYSNLFSGSSSIGEDFWVGMEAEIEKGKRAVKRFFSGTRGFLIISGERSSGKSSLSKHLANLHFPKENIFSLRAPRESIADQNLFEQTLLNSLNSQDSLHYIMNVLPPKSVIIINDLELWWERKPFGTQVVEKIISLMQEYGHKILFIINVNTYALKIINQLCSLNTWALDIIFCQPFDARELKDLIMIRHQAGGMKFILNKKHEDDMTNWDYARLFNRLFSLSSGNPGYAINLWLAGIKKISGNILFMEEPFTKEITIPEQLPEEEILFIMQFILHRRFSVKSLSEILNNDYSSTEKNIRKLLQKGILTEKFPDVYSLNPALEIHLVKKLKSLDLL